MSAAKDVVSKDETEMLSTCLSWIVGRKGLPVPLRSQSAREVPQQIHWQTLSMEIHVNVMSST